MRPPISMGKVLPLVFIKFWVKVYFTLGQTLLIKLIYFGVIYYTFMAKEDWATTKIPVLLMEAIDRFINTDIAKKNGIFSRPDFVTALLVGWFSQFEKEFGIFLPRDVRRNLKGFDVMKPFD